MQIKDNVEHVKHRLEAHLTSCLTKVCWIYDGKDGAKRTHGSRNLYKVQNLPYEGIARDSCYVTIFFFT